MAATTAEEPRSSPELRDEGVLGALGVLGDLGAQGDLGDLVDLGDETGAGAADGDDAEELFASTESTLEPSPSSPDAGSPSEEEDDEDDDEAVAATAAGPQGRLGEAQGTRAPDRGESGAAAAAAAATPRLEQQPLLDDSDGDDLFGDGPDEDDEEVRPGGPPPGSALLESPPLVPPAPAELHQRPPAQDAQHSHSSTDEVEEEEAGDNVCDLVVNVTEPEKVGDGMNAYMVYHVNTKTSLSGFRGSEFGVKRRFSDFLGLHSKLSTRHGAVGVIVPPAPEKSVIGMTKVKVGKEDPSSAEFVEKRRSSLERYLQRVAKHPTLLQDPDFRDFLERDELPRAVSTQALSGAGLMRIVSKAAEAVNKMTIKMSELDPWFEEKQLQFESLDQQLRRLHGSVEGLVVHRKDLALCTSAFARSVAMLGTSEDHTALSRALSQLAEVEERVEGLHGAQAQADSFLLAELLADYVRLIGSVKAVFDQRVRCWQRWQDAQVTLQKKREAEAKLQSGAAAKGDKLQQARDDIHEWEGKVEQGEAEFESISKTIRTEVARFERERVRDFKHAVVSYLEALVHTQAQLVKYWEGFLPEAKAII
uniref:Sorting nexin-2 n=1 Tax=Petromyzon marinus TaxID=7757 RepID=A0AAJ7XCS2_PETMA|nr:sorting nexin-2-like isoform X2 [Petromyzon marinus]